MTLIKTTTLCILMIASNTFAGGPPNPIELRYDNCTIKNEGDASAQHACNKKYVVKWDKLLNKNYNSLMRKYNKKQKAALRKTQRSWLKFRDDQIAFLRLDSNILALSWGNLETVKQRALTLGSYVEDIALAEKNYQGYQAVDPALSQSGNKTRDVCNWGEGCGSEDGEMNAALTTLGKKNIAVAQIIKKDEITFTIMNDEDTSRCKNPGSDATQMSIFIDHKSHTASRKCLRKEGNSAVYEYNLYGRSAYKMISRFKAARGPIEVGFHSKLKVRFSSTGFTKAYRAMVK